MPEVFNKRCSFNGCQALARAGSINGWDACIEHIDWAMRQTLSPAKEIERLMKTHWFPDDEKLDV